MNSKNGKENLVTLPCLKGENSVQVWHYDTDKNKRMQLANV